MDILTGLNPQQRQAVTAPAGATLVLAGPGSGKTRVLTQRVVYLISEGVPAHRILAVTFTNRAAREMRVRIGRQMEGNTRGLNVGTFHATCARLLRGEAKHLSHSRDFIIYDSADQRTLVKQAMAYHRIDTNRFQPVRIHSTISTAKNELVGPAEFSRDSYYHEIVGRVYETYQQQLRENNARDFDDLLMDTVGLLQREPEVREQYQHHFERILVDEFQDTNLAQYTLLQLLAGEYRQLYVVGDPDQSIYRWRGADYRNVQRFQQDYPDATVVLLEQNYRSTQTILDAAMAVIDQNRGRTAKELFTERSGGSALELHEAYDEEEEAGFVVDAIAGQVLREKCRPGDCAIMYRTNAQSRVLEEAFIRAGVPYRLVGATRFYGRREIKDLLAFLRLAHNPRDGVSLERVLNVPPRGIGRKAVEALQAAAAGTDESAATLLLELAREGTASAHYEIIGSRLTRPLAAFGQLLDDWLRAAREGRPVAQLLQLILKDTEYQSYILDGSESGRERWENVQELRKVTRDFGDTELTAVLEQIALVADVDGLGAEQDGSGAPSLMTLHSAKGLEFPLVFIVGLNDGVLPHRRSFDEPEEMAEERRLFYVGLTRAKEQVYLTHTFRRRNFGDDSLGLPSRFLDDIPEELLSGDVTGRRPRSRPQAQRNVGLRQQTVTGARGASAAASTPAALQFSSGQRVSHSSFGPGMEIESKPVGDDEMVIVAFDGVGVKRLVAGAANLQVEAD